MILLVSLHIDAFDRDCYRDTANTWKEFMYIQEWIFDEDLTSDKNKQPLKAVQINCRNHV